jgi:hypothetical protein
MTSLLHSGLLEDAIQGTRGKIVARFAGDCDATGLACVLELAVAAADGHKIPAIGLQQAQHFANFHAASIAGRRTRRRLRAGLLTGATNSSRSAMATPMPPGKHHMLCAPLSQPLQASQRDRQPLVELLYQHAAEQEGEQAREGDAVNHLHASALRHELVLEDHAEQGNR